ncbi:methionyl-tRNA formyltransferase [Sphingobacteriaceae bacterium]|nr:methionyl-tRNA formyltransferase [Sphingobacteriaceae bacterium]
MRIVFMGTPEFAVASLESLLKNNFNIVGVVTAPDKPAGRGQQLHQSAVKKFALENNLKVLQPEKLKDPDFINELKNLNADLQIVVAFRMLPEVVWNMPTQGTYNLHASLLPKYRGAAPINWAIINGETETGVTTFKLKHEIDTGNILFKEKVPVTETMNAGELHDVLMKTGSELIVKTVRAIEESTNAKIALTFLEQNDKETCHAPKLFKESCRIDWEKPVIEIYNLIRGLSPHPTAYTEIHAEGQAPLSLKLFSSKYTVISHENTNGSLLTDNKTFLRVFAGEGYLDITELQLQGKKRMMVADFLRGFKVISGTRLS